MVFGMPSVTTAAEFFRQPRRAALEGMPVGVVPVRPSWRSRVPLAVSGERGVWPSSGRWARSRRTGAW